MKFLPFPDKHEPFIGQLTTSDCFNALRRLKPGAYDLAAAAKQTVFGANTYSGSLTTDFLQPDAVSKIVAAFAPLKAFTTLLNPDPYKPKATNQIKFVTTASATQTNPTSFQAGGSVINPISVSVTHYNQPFSVGPLEYQQGLRIEDLIPENALALANTLAGVIATNFTAANFPATPIASDPASFNLSLASSAYTAIKASPTKNLVLDGDYYSKLSHIAGFDTGTRYGWTGIYSQSAGWASADPKTRGFATAPTGIVCVTGFLVPQTSPIIKTRHISLGEDGPAIPIELNIWFDPSTRTQWGSLDVILGANAADGTAGVLIQSLN